MSDTFGKIFKVTTAGTSHGPSLSAVIKGCPQGLKVSVQDIQKDLNRRRPGQSIITSPRKETDKIEVLSGITKGRATGQPIRLRVKNLNAKAKDYLYRPGQADYTWINKYGLKNLVGGGRASGRETVMRVAAGAIAKKIIAPMKIIGYTKEVYCIKAEKIDYSEIAKNPLRFPDKKKASRAIALIKKVASQGDSVGGVVEIIVKNVPLGLGYPVFDKLEADLAKALMSIGGVKGFEIGAGYEATKMLGSEHNDAMRGIKGKVKFLSNNAGGVLGGISSGQDLIMRIFVKPTPSIAKEQLTINHKKKNSKIKVLGRHDPCLCPRIVPVAEAMVALVLADHFLRF